MPRKEDIQLPRKEDIQSPRKEDIQSPGKEDTQSPRKEDIQSPRKENIQSPRKEDTQSPRKEDTQSPRKEDTQSPRKEDIQSPRKEDIQSPRKEDIQSPRKEDIQSPRKEGMQSPRKEGMQSPRKEGMQSPRKEGMQSPRKEDMQSARKEGLQSPRKEGLQSPRKEDMQSPRKEGMQSPRKEGLQSPRKEGMQSPRKEGMQSLRKEGMQSPRKEELQAPGKEELQALRTTVLQGHVYKDLKTQESKELEIKVPRELEIKASGTPEVQVPEEREVWCSRDLDAPGSGDPDVHMPREPKVHGSGDPGGEVSASPSVCSKSVNVSELKELKKDEKTYSERSSETITLSSEQLLSNNPPTSVASINTSLAASSSNELLAFRKDEQISKIGQSSHLVNNSWKSSAMTSNDFPSKMVSSSKSTSMQLMSTPLNEKILDVTSANSEPCLTSDSLLSLVPTEKYEATICAASSSAKVISVSCPRPLSSVHIHSSALECSDEVPRTPSKFSPTAFASHATSSISSFTTTKSQSNPSSKLQERICKFSEKSGTAENPTTSLCQTGPPYFSCSAVVTSTLPTSQSLVAFSPIFTSSKLISKPSVLEGKCANADSSQPEKRKSVTGFSVADLLNIGSSKDAKKSFTSVSSISVCDIPLPPRRDDSVKETSCQPSPVISSNETGISSDIAGIPLPSTKCKGEQNLSNFPIPTLNVSTPAIVKCFAENYKIQQDVKFGNVFDKKHNTSMQRECTMDEKNCETILTNESNSSKFSFIVKKSNLSPNDPQQKDTNEESKSLNINYSKSCSSSHLLSDVPSTAVSSSLVELKPLARRISGPDSSDCTLDRILNISEDPSRKKVVLKSRWDVKYGDSDSQRSDEKDNVSSVSGKYSITCDVPDYVSEEFRLVDVPKHDSALAAETSHFNSDESSSDEVQFTILFVNSSSHFLFFITSFFGLVIKVFEYHFTS